jgi:hypothetical protein
MSAELKDALVMVLTEASKTVISISFELGNLVTDLLTTYRVVFEDTIVILPQYRVPYAVFGCLAIMVGLVSMVHQVQRAYRLRLQIKSNAIVEQETDAGTDLEDHASRAVVHKLKWELEKVSRDFKALAVGMLCLILADVPMVRAHRLDPQKCDWVDSESLSVCSAWQAVMTALLVLKENVTDKTVRYLQLER